MNLTLSLELQSISIVNPASSVYIEQLAWHLSCVNTIRYFQVSEIMSVCVLLH